MDTINRRNFLTQATILGVQCSFLGSCVLETNAEANVDSLKGIMIDSIQKGEDIFQYILRAKGEMDISLYRQIVGAASEFKEGDQTLGIAAKNKRSRDLARQLLRNTTLGDIEKNSLYEDELYVLIQATTIPDEKVNKLSLGELKSFLLTEDEEAIKSLMPALSSDVIGCVVKLMSNEELIAVGQKVFNPLPGSKIGSKGYMGARIQPNSPTDNIDDITWQVFNAWSFAVGDLVLGTNPVSSEPESVARIEAALLDILRVFELEETLPNCVLSHIDIQSDLEDLSPASTGIWFQSLAGTVAANKTFDLSIDKMLNHASKRKGKYGLYFETGQGADFTNGHGEGFDMLMHESRKYGFARALKQKIEEQNSSPSWVHLNDVAGFIGPEVFKTKEQLVRCCLEDIVMGKLHGLTIGLDICSTLHMDVSLEDLDWCIDQVMPANPAYLMALPTKNDPMLSYLTTSFGDHVRVREKFGYKVADKMWAFFKRIGIIDQDDQPTEHFGDPVWVYYQYLLAKGDGRSKNEIYEEGRSRIEEIRKRGVPIAEGYGNNIWDLAPELDRQVHELYEDAKISIWTEMSESFIQSIPAVLSVESNSIDRKDYIYHPESGEKLTKPSINALKELRKRWRNDIPDVQIIISDGLNPRALSDQGHLDTFVSELNTLLSQKGLSISKNPVFITNGRVRAGYECGEILYGGQYNSSQNKGIIHIIGERPGSGHHNFSAYLTATTTDIWGRKGEVDHNITRVVSGISDTAFDPLVAAEATVNIFEEIFSKTT